VLDNFIGVDQSGTHGVANLNGIEIAGTGNTIGGAAAGSTNVISANKSDGILIDSAGSGNLFLHNDVGTDYTGKNPVANSGNGVEIAGNQNTVGGNSSGAGNIISGNSKNGVLVSAGKGNTISRNSIFGNTGLGISLASGANNNIVPPTLSSATLSGTTLTVTGNFTAPTANVSYVLEFFANPSGDAEGKIYLGSLTVTPTTTGTQLFTFITTTTVTGTSWTSGHNWTRSEGSSVPGMCRQ
jgi:parallel beta-helix repeat protein